MIRSVGGRPACSRARRRASLLTLSLWRDFDFAKLNARLILSTGVAQLFLGDARSDRSEESLTTILLSSRCHSTVRRQQFGRDSHVCHVQVHVDLLDRVPGPSVAPERGRKKKDRGERTRLKPFLPACQRKSPPTAGVRELQPTVPEEKNPEPAAQGEKQRSIIGKTSVSG